MQYLSKAYNYYSGINPATLSGAIDVIVVKHVDENGEVSLSSSPFHVRFGKLQVLRAGDKRVTVRLPNNLPHPHVAPFDMKVSETGEAFFVLETEEDVPEELLTSPVVAAADDIGLPPSPPPSDEEFPSTQLPPESPTDLSQSLTQEPFGSTEKQTKHLASTEHESEVLPDVEPLDLNEHDAGTTGRTAHIATRDDVAGDVQRISGVQGHPSETISDDEPYDESAARKLGSPVVSTTRPPPNPITAGPGEKAELPSRDHRLSNYKKHIGSAASGLPDDHLPKVKPGEGEGPDVLYGRDVVLDMAGYHNAGKVTGARPDGPIEDAHEKGAEEPDGRRKSATLGTDLDGQIVETLPKEAINSLIRDLLSALPTHDTDQVLHDQRDAAEPARRYSAQDGRTDSPASSKSISPERSSAPRPVSTTPRQRFERGQSEPPQVPESFEPQRHSRQSSQAAIDPPHSPSSQVERPAPSNAIAPGSGGPRISDESLRDSTKKGIPSIASIKDLGRSASTPPTADEHLERRTRGGSMPPIEHSPSIPKTEAQPNHGVPRLSAMTDNPYLFSLRSDDGPGYSFEVAICEAENFAANGQASDEERALFLDNRVTVRQFLDDPQIVDDPRLVVSYSLMYMTWSTAYPLLLALSMHRRALSSQGSVNTEGELPPLSEIGLGSAASSRPVSGYGWSRWWRRAPTDAEPIATTAEALKSPTAPLSPPPSVQAVEKPMKNYAKTLRLSSEQLKQLNLKPGPNTITFSAASSYSGQAICTARIFLWEDKDQIVISDIDGTITKSDALGHVFAAIGRDWTHIGIAKLYTDICNNGYKILYLTSRAIGQADSTREYLKSINQDKYRLPEGPVIMSPDRLIASLHREVIMRKPELFKMACLRDILRLFGNKSREAFYAGFGNRITDAMSYRSVGIPAAKIYTIDSTGVVKTELLHTSGHKGSYMGLNDLVNEVFPSVKTKFQPEYTDFNYWRPTLPEFALPDLTPPSPALSARSDSSRLSVGVLGKIASIGRRASKQPILPTTNDPKDRKNVSSRPSSPLIRPAMTPDDLSEAEEEEEYISRTSRTSSMPGSLAERGEVFSDEFVTHTGYEQRKLEEARSQRSGDDDFEDGEDEDSQTVDDSFEDGAIFDDDILATGEMRNVPF